MKRQTSKPAADQRLRVSASFALGRAHNGRAYVAKDSEPYTQFWVSERERLLHCLFGGRAGANIRDVTDAYFRATGLKANAAELKRVQRSIGEMRNAGVLMEANDDPSRYTAQMVDAYVRHRPFPRALSQRMVQMAQIHQASQVLDLAGGPGDLALALAKVSDQVAMMDLSRGFVRAASRRAKRMGLTLTPIHDSCNRLLSRDEEYDVVAISQALHWMDDVQICRGLCRCLKAAGSFFVVQGGFEVDAVHPLAYLLGSQSILGDKPPISFAEQAQALMRRLTLLFEALDAPALQRVDLSHRHGAMGSELPWRIVPKSATVFCQLRPMGAGFARAFLTPRHIASTGLTPGQFWRDLEQRCAGATPAQLMGRYDWSLLHFQRDGKPEPSAQKVNPEPISIAFEEAGTED